MIVKSLRGKAILDELKRCGITHIVWLPDSEVRFMYDDMMSQHDIALVPVCREGEAIPIAAGLTLGGKNPVVLHQNSGLFEAGDSVRGLGIDLPLPLLMLIGYEGWWRDTPVTDSAAIFTTPILDAWGIKHYLVENNEDVEKISLAYQETHKTNKPVAVLITRERK